MDSSSDNSEKQKIDLAFKLIERFDRLRVSVQSRASVVLTADSLLIAATTALVSSFFAKRGGSRLVEGIFVMILMGTYGSLALSLYFVTQAMLSIFKGHRELFPNSMEGVNGLFFHPRDTIDHFKVYSLFEREFIKSTSADFVHYALSEL